MIKREDGITYIATISGGKDSTVMCDLLLKNKYPVDHIIFTDTLAEFDEMYTYLDTVNKYFKLRYQKEITILKPKMTPEDLIFSKIKYRKGVTRAGHIKGVFNPLVGFCEWRRQSKIEPLEKWKVKNNIKECKTYIGITTDEKNRADWEHPFNLYPLITEFNMSETKCQEYLINQEMENPLYRHFTRTGCAFCPAQSLEAKYKVWKHYPEVWKRMKDIEEKLYKLENSGEKVISIGWHGVNREKIEDLEKQFIKSDAQGSLFDFEDEPLKDCFCKI